MFCIIGIGMKMFKFWIKPENVALDLMFWFTTSPTVPEFLLLLSKSLHKFVSSCYPTKLSIYINFDMH